MFVMLPDCDPTASVLSFGCIHPGSANLCCQLDLGESSWEPRMAAQATSHYAQIVAICYAGISRLADGSVLVTGGNDSGRTSLFNVTTGDWSSRRLMNIGRGYQV